MENNINEREEIKRVKENQATKWFNFRYICLQILSCILIAVTGLFKPIKIAYYPAQQPNLGNSLAGVISLSNITATLVSVRKNPRKIKIFKIIGMIGSIALGIAGYIGFSRITPVVCYEWNSSGFLSACTKYGVYAKKIDENQ